MEMKRRLRGSHSMRPPLNCDRYCPATMTLPVEELKQILSVAAKYKKNGTSPKAADLVGINMEGPFYQQS